MDSFSYLKENFSKWKISTLFWSLVINVPMFYYMFFNGQPSDAIIFTYTLYNCIVFVVFLFMVADGDLNDDIIFPLSNPIFFPTALGIFCFIIVITMTIGEWLFDGILNRGTGPLKKFNDFLDDIPNRFRK